MLLPQLLAALSLFTPKRAPPGARNGAAGSIGTYGQGDTGMKAGTGGTRRGIDSALADFLALTGKAVLGGVVASLGLGAVALLIATGGQGQGG